MLQLDCGGPSHPATSNLCFEERDPCSAQHHGDKNILWETAAWLPSKVLGIRNAAAATLVESNKLLSEIFTDVRTCAFLFPKDAIQALLQGFFLPWLLSVETKLRNSRASCKGA